MSLLSNESDDVMPSGFSGGVEVEETFADAPAAEQREPASEPPASASPTDAAESGAAPEAEDQLEVVPAPAADATEAVYEEQLERRLREAEELVTRTIERMRLDEERRLVEWVRERREEEERRIAEWAEERRTAIERSLEQRASIEEGLVRRVEDLLVEWQARFEQRLEQRRLDDERVAERRRMNDEERLRAWRGELEQALSERFSEQRRSEGASPPDWRGELDASVREAIANATSARDVGRILRGAVSEVAATSTFAVALHHNERDDVAYRYRVATDDDLGTVLRGEALDDGRDSPAAHVDGWVRARRAVRVGSRNATVHTAQLAIRDQEATIGVLTIQTEANAVPDALLARVSDLVTLAAPRLGELRASGSFRGA